MYDGEVDEGGVPDGNGTFTCSEFIYRGEWRAGAQYGAGATTYVTGTVHTGLYANNRRHGHGVTVWADSGRRFEGEYRQGRRHGQGEMIYPNGDRYSYLRSTKHSVGCLCTPLDLREIMK